MTKDKIKEEIGILRRLAYGMPESVEAWTLLNVANRLEKQLNGQAQNDA